MGSSVSVDVSDIGYLRIIAGCPCSSGPSRE
jgi:hypothetical protein